MKKLLIAAVLIVGAHQAYQHFGSSQGAFDASGTAETILFTFDGCGKPCNDAHQFLAKRNVSFLELNTQASVDHLDKFKSFGGRSTYPLIVVGDTRIQGYRPPDVATALAGAYGFSAVTSAERTALAKNFTDTGAPRIVMYGTQSCGYCRKARAYFDQHGLDYTEYDIEKSPIAARDFKTLYGGGTPLIYYGFNRASGFNKREIASQLKI